MDNNVDATNTPLEYILSQYKDGGTVKSDDDCVEYIDEGYSIAPSYSQGYALELHDKTSETEKTASAVVKVIEEYNQKYNLTLPTNLSDIKELISCIATREMRDLYVVALSEAADRIILGTVTSALITVSAMIAELTSESSIARMSLEEKVGVLDRLMLYLGQLLDIQQRLGINNPKLAMKTALQNNQDAIHGKKKVDVAAVDNILDMIKGQIAK